MGKGGLVAVASSAIPWTVGCLVGKEKCYSNLEFMEDIIPGKKLLLLIGGTVFQ